MDANVNSACKAKTPRRHPPTTETENTKIGVRKVPILFFVHARQVGVAGKGFYLVYFFVSVLMCIQSVTIRTKTVCCVQL